jgi:hypothetical protein
MPNTKPNTVKVHKNGSIEYCVELPDGFLAYRKTENREYTHLATARRSTTTQYGVPGEWIIVGWSSRRDLAEKALAPYRKYMDGKGKTATARFDSFRILEVPQPTDEQRAIREAAIAVRAVKYAERDAELRAKYPQYFKD